MEESEECHCFIDKIKNGFICGKLEGQLWLIGSGKNEQEPVVMV